MKPNICHYVKIARTKLHRYVTPRSEQSEKEFGASRIDDQNTKTNHYPKYYGKHKNPAEYEVNSQLNTPTSFLGL
jgi:hypothetical protein